MTISFQNYTLLVADAFRLESSRDELPPGLYRVESETEQMNGASFQAQRWLFTTIRPVDGAGRTVPGKIYEMTRAELTQVLTCHASVLQPPNMARAPLPLFEALPRTDALAIELACNEGMAARS